MAKHKKCTKLGEWQKRAKNGGECEECHQYKKALTVDHIVPKHIVEQLDETGGAIYEMDDNFQMLCSVCNALVKNSY